MITQKEQGSAHVIIIIIALLVIVGLVGVLFWQNVINKKDETSNKKVAVTSDTSKASSSPKLAPEPSVDPIVDAKAGVAKAMNTDQYAGLESYMASSVESILGHSDANALKAGPSETVKSLYQHFVDYATWNRQQHITKWTFADVKDITNEKLKKQIAGAPSYYENTYIGIGEGSPDDGLVAFRFNDQGKVTYIFYDMVLGY